MTAYELVLEELRAEPRKWLVTGAAGFIGSHLVETLLRNGQQVVGVDNFSTGTPLNLDDVKRAVGEEAWSRFTCLDGTIANIGICREASNRVDFVLHQAAFTSVPLSIEDPVACHDTNVTGTLNLLVAARDNRVSRFVYASSKAVYGDSVPLPNSEEQTGSPGSPYGTSKLMGELYASQFARHYGLESIGLRYFNVFGPRQNPVGRYAAVIPQWIDTRLRGKICRIHGDGSNTRDFCPVSSIVQANILAATAKARIPIGTVLNIALGRSTSLKEAYGLISEYLAAHGIARCEPEYTPSRPGDISHSSADISLAARLIGYSPQVDLRQGLEVAVRWNLEDAE